jgi:hypothetical protein
MAAAAAAAAGASAARRAPAAAAAIAGAFSPPPGLIPTMQAAASIMWLLATVGALVAYSVPALRPATVYGRLLGGDGGGDRGGGGGAVKRAVRAAAAVTVPKRWFVVFYVVGLAVDAVVLVTAAAAGYPRVALAVVALHAAHVARRLAECVWVHAWSHARMPAHLWAAGIAHYVMAPWSLLPPCAGVPGLLGLLGLPGGGGGGAPPPPGPLAALALVRGLATVVAGVGLFVAGNVVQAIVHRQLAALRDPAAGEGGAPAAAGGRGAGGASGDPPPRPRRRQAGADAGGDTGTSGAAAPFLDVDLSPVDGPGGTGSGPATPTAAPVAPGADGAASAALAASPAARYPLPRGGFFDLAVCPHYTAEIAVYVGLIAVQAGGAAVFGGRGGAPPPGACADPAPAVTAPGAVLLAAWVAANLCVTGARTRAWYVSTYPRDQRVRYTAAVVPFLW